MEPTEPPGGAVPYFFLSYARMPRDGSGRTNPDLWVHDLFHELCDCIDNLTDHPGMPGFMDGSMKTGQLWNAELDYSLARCRVFVPLYSPRYFISSWCGKEWTAFSNRTVRHRNPGPLSTPSAVVPALWAPVPDNRLPECVKGVQYMDPEFGEAYRENGFYGLAKLTSFRGDYEKAIHHLAKRIVAVGESVVVQPGRRNGLSTAHDAFAATSATTSTTRRTLRVSVAAATLDRLPEGRARDYYGPSALDWNPYHPTSERPLAQIAADIAVDLALRPDVREFDHTSRPAEGPEVLLLDRWVLRDAERRDNLGEFDRSDLPLTGLVVPWNENDPDSDEAEFELAAQTEATLTRRIRVGRQVCRPAVRGVPDPSAFDAVLRYVVQWAESEYRKRAQPRPPVGDSTPRFRLRGNDSFDSRSQGRLRNAEEEDRDEQS
ncbi:TIR-like protein FxsC [Streptomyces sp. NPDC057280]|uniref:TIR-like protein FxsC n=1 Tax=Streptomyces sp. NPDC057280 TaxID=3346081 RepID=UPI0036458656